MKKQLILTAAVLLSASAAMADHDVTAEKAVAESSFPAEWKDVTDARKVSLPEVPTITSSNTFTITDAAYGASATAKNNTTAIQNALNAAKKAGGGMVVIPEGVFLCGPITIGSKTILHLAKGATLKALPLKGYGEAVSDGDEYYPTKDGKSFNIMITNENNSTDIIIEGEDSLTSVIDGQGKPYWALIENTATKDVSRPSLIRFKTGSKFLVRYLRLQNSPSTNLTLGQSGNASHFTVHDISIKNPASTLGTGKASHNTDGIPMWGPYINIYNCTIDTGDDNIVTDTNARFVHAWNLTMGAGHGASMGSFTTNMHHIIYENMTFNGTETALRLKTNTGRSGEVYDIIFRNMTINNCTEIPIQITLNYDSYVEPSQMATSSVTATTPKFHDILFKDIKGTCTYKKAGANKRGQALFLYGRPESHIKNVTFDHVRITANNGILMAYCDDVTFQNGCEFVNKSASSQGDFTALYEATYTGKYYDPNGYTAIESVSADKDQETAVPAAYAGKCYNLMGQQVNKDAKGIVISNGKKYYNK